MNPLVALAAALFPELLRIIATDRDGAVTSAIASEVQRFAGTSDPVAADDLLRRDAGAAFQLRTALARIALDAMMVDSAAGKSSAVDPAIRVVPADPATRTVAA